MTDNRWGIGLWSGDHGDRLWGASTPVPNVGYGLEIDWHDYGSFTGDSEANRMISWSMFRGRRNMLLSTGGGFESIQTGSLTIVMDNSDGRYDGWNAASPLYPNVSPGHDVRFRILDMSTNTKYSVFFGTLVDIIPSGYGTSKPCVTLKIEDGWRYLRTIPASVAVQTTPTVDAAAALVLSSAKWPTRWGSSLDSFADVIPYYWALGGNFAGAELENLANAYLSHFYIDNTGKARLQNRTTISATVQNYDEGTSLKNIGNPQPWTNRFNVTRIKTHPRKAAASGTIYQLNGATPSILPGAAQSLTLLVGYTYNNTPCPAISVITPVATTDYTANSLANGSGTDKTANCSVVYTDFGDTGKITITNNDASLVYLTSLRVRGSAIYESNVSDVTYPTDMSTVPQPRQFVLDLLAQQDINVGLSFSQVLGPFLALNHPFPVVQIESRPALQYAPDLFDIVSASFPTIGVNGISFRVAGIEHSSDTTLENCQKVTTTFYLEPYISPNAFWLWDTASTFDTLTVFGY